MVQAYTGSIRERYAFHYVLRIFEGNNCLLHFRRLFVPNENGGQRKARNG